LARCFRDPYGTRSTAYINLTHLLAHLDANAIHFLRIAIIHEAAAVIPWKYVTPPHGRAAEYCDVYVCLSLCVFIWTPSVSGVVGTSTEALKCAHIAPGMGEQSTGPDSAAE